MKLLGLIGYPLSHSHSPELFRELFHSNGITDCEYRLFPLESISGLPNLLESLPNLTGFNVTVPHKESILPYLSHLSPEAEKIAAVNAVKVQRKQGRVLLYGHNTDADGFMALLEKAGQTDAKGALVLGTGGSSKAVRCVLESKNIPCIPVSRTPKENCLTYDELSEELFRTHPLIIHTTPAGMFPETGTMAPVPDLFTPGNTLIDLVYNPGETLLMKKARLMGARAFNGLIMLRKQAEKAWEFFRD